MAGEDDSTGDLPKGQLFFSYAHDDRERAAPIIAALKQAGYAVWWDDHLQGGSSYADRIQQALDSAAAIVVLWSANSIRSHWVLDEAELGRTRGVLVPLVMDAAQPPLGFRQLQAIDVDGWQGQPGHPAMLRVLSALEAKQNGTDIPVDHPAFESIAAQPARFALDRRKLMIGGGGIAALGIFGFLGLHFTGSSAAAAGVAVLPFRNLTGDPQQDYLSAGLSEELRSMLSRNQALRIVARTSCEAVAERGLEAVTIAEELSVSHLLDGSLRQTPAGLAIAVELINGKTGFTDWSQDFEGNAKQILAVQRGIIDAVTQALTAEYRQTAEDEAGSTANAAAFDAYLQANALFLTAISTETDLAALSLYDRAIALDPEFGAARSARARTLVALGNTSTDVQAAQEYYEAAAVSARAAVAAAPASADTQSTLGLVLFQAQLKVVEARAPYEQSYALGQGSAAIVGRYGVYAAQTGQHEIAAIAMGSALSLDPLNPTVVRSAGFAKYAAGDYLGANDLMRQALALNPELGDSYARIGMGLILQGKPQEAVDIAASESFALVRETCLAIAYDRLGNRAAADTAMAALVGQYADASMYQQAQILAAWGREDAAMEALEKASILRDSGLTYLNIDPFLDPLRNRPDFLNLLSALGYD